MIIHSSAYFELAAERAHQKIQINPQGFKLVTSIPQKLPKPLDMFGFGILAVRRDGRRS